MITFQFVNNPHSIDRSYKFIYRQLDIKFHRYLYHEGDKIEFLSGEIPETGERMDNITKVDDEWIQMTEFMSKPVYDDKMHALYNYHDYMRHDRKNAGLEIKSNVKSIANPNHGIDKVEIDNNITFHIDVEFFKNRDGWEVLNTISDKVTSQEELSDDEAIDLLVLPDMDIDVPIKELMTTIINLVAEANIPDEAFKNDINCCLVYVLERFFSGDEWSEMVRMLETATQDPKVAYLTEKFGAGFGQIYLDGKEDGEANGFKNGVKKGFQDANLANAKKLLAKGVDLEIISECTSISITKLKSFKREL